jgi:hypothetical protein
MGAAWLTVSSSQCRRESELSAQEFARENYYAGDMDPDELVAGLIALTDDETGDRIRALYYRENADLEDVVSIVF